MGGLVTLVAIFIVCGLVLGTIAFVAYRRVLRRAKGVERGLKMVPLLIHLPPPSQDVQNTGTRSEVDIMRSRVAEAQSLYDLLAGTAQAGFKSNFYGQRHIAFEIVANAGLVHYFVAVPIAMVGVVEQAIVTAYPGARLEEVEDHNIFNPQAHLAGTVGGELVLKHEAAYPIATIDKMEKDPMVGLINSLYKLQPGDGAAIQIMVRPASSRWAARANKLVAGKRHTRQGGLGFGVLDVAKGAVKTSEEWREKAKTFEVSKLEEDTLQGIEEKTKHPGFEVLVRVLASSPNYDRSHMLLQSMATAFALFEAPGSNGFQFIEGRDMQGLVTAFIFRFFPPELTSTVLNSVELATLFHLPDAQFTPTTQVERQQSKQVDGPINMPASGLLLGYNFYRGVKKEIRLSEQDRRRHTYIIGQTGTGKSTILENLAVQDMLAGNGFAFIDPHGDVAEKLISMVPKERAEDIVYFNPGDMERPLGFNLFEYSDPTQRDFLIQESINMLYKLYDPGHTGIIGPRFEHWFRNAALTLMADPNGASFIEIPKVFTDSTYLKNKFKYLTDPTVIDFWTKEMGQTSDYHKSEMLGFFVSKFGAFQSNEMMRNIIGQTHSSFNLRELMDQKKILIVNLGKGQVGDLNAQLLGMMFVMKFQVAAMSRSNVPEEQREDFSLYVDEFQNFSTDSFASILSEARKYRLNLIVANQFIGQLTDEIRDAVFGNVGTMMSYRCGPEDAEFLVKQFQPIFDERDLVNLPNYNAVMKLLVGGLPSQPFSITALPPLGQAHAEMGLAVKQLSAAKFGTPRATVEAEIFARLQNQAVPPRPAAPVTPAPSPAAAPVAPVPQATAATAPAVAPPLAASPAPVPQPAQPATSPPAAPPVVSAPPAPTTPPTDISPLLPAPRGSAAAPPLPQSVVPAPSVPVAPVPTGAPASTSVAPLAPSAPPVAPPKPAPPAADELSLAELSQAAPPPSPTLSLPGSPPPPAQKLIEAHEPDGQPATPSLTLTRPPATKLIEAEEKDGLPATNPAPASVQPSAQQPPAQPVPQIQRPPLQVTQPPAPTAPPPAQVAAPPTPVSQSSAPRPQPQAQPKPPRPQPAPKVAPQSAPTPAPVLAPRPSPKPPAPKPAAPVSAPPPPRPKPVPQPVAQPVSQVHPVAPAQVPLPPKPAPQPTPDVAPPTPTPPRPPAKNKLGSDVMKHADQMMPDVQQGSAEEIPINGEADQTVQPETHEPSGATFSHKPKVIQPLENIPLPPSRQHELDDATATAAAAADDDLDVNDITPPVTQPLIPGMTINPPQAGGAPGVAAAAAVAPDLISEAVSASYVAAAAPKPLIESPEPPILGSVPLPPPPTPGAVEPQPVPAPAAPATPAAPPPQPAPPSKPKPAPHEAAKPSSKKGGRKTGKANNQPEPAPAPVSQAPKPTPQPAPQPKPEPAPAPTPKPPEPPVVTPDPPQEAGPKLRPGEIFVDAQGNVLQG